MKIITTPVLYRSASWSDGLSTQDYKGALHNDFHEIGFCLNEVEKLWHVPESAKRFWFQVVPKPEANSIKVKVKAIGLDLVWSLLKNPGQISCPKNYFETSRGLQTLLEKAGLDLTEWTAINVRLLYE